MRWEARPKNLRPRFFVIEHDPKMGFMVYVYEGNRCIHDWFQPTFETAVGFAKDDLGVPEDSWEKTILE